MIPARSKTARTRHGLGCSCHWLTGIACSLALAVCCVPVQTSFVGLPVETQFAFTNFSATMYAVLGVREHSSSPGAFAYTPLLPPGGTLRTDFFSFVGSRCPAAFDLQLLLYRRINQDQPIGMDPGEAVDSVPTVAAQVDDVPACSVQALETYTIVNWEAAEGTARVKIAQCSAVDEAIGISDLFPNADVVWELAGVEPGLALMSPPALAPMSPVTGRVVEADGKGVPGVVVLLRSRFRTRLDCANPDNPADAGYGDPLAFAVTDQSGRFQIDRPAGVYRLEFFSDEFAFRPGLLDIETPLDEITTLAEPLP